MIYKRGQHWHMDVVVNDIRYREALNTTDGREAKQNEKNRIAETHQGKGASKAGREFGRKPFGEAAEQFLEDRKPHVSERTAQLEKERLKPLRLAAKRDIVSKLENGLMSAPTQEPMSQRTSKAVN